ncbi:MAG TPA: hypothetical protein PLD20_09925 [Blastocatellia bacterium]|nr:hypothetical protein [Blastocatellia bacterium]HMV84188.1 hypothetical protein [Blastocatellia bacterium]HMZ18237.1 hypothetical protein [Blastocatellia bacterium]HNG33091.1 hypothetical protein [Blastocatellia bacterium]
MRFKKKWKEQSIFVGRWVRFTAKAIEMTMAVADTVQAKNNLYANAKNFFRVSFSGVAAFTSCSAFFNNIAFGFFRRIALARAWKKRNGVFRQRNRFAGRRGCDEARR